MCHTDLDTLDYILEDYRGLPWHYISIHVVHRIVVRPQLPHVFAYCLEAHQYCLSMTRAGSEQHAQNKAHSAKDNSRDKSQLYVSEKMDSWSRALMHRVEHASESAPLARKPAAKRVFIGAWRARTCTCLGPDLFPTYPLHGMAWQPALPSLICQTHLWVATSTPAWVSGRKCY